MLNAVADHAVQFSKIKLQHRKGENETDVITQGGDAGTPGFDAGTPEVYPQMILDQAFEQGQQLLLLS